MLVSPVVGTAGPSPALSRSTTALPLPLALRGSDPPSRGDPIQLGPQRALLAPAGGGAQRRGEKPLRCADPTRQGLPLAKAPPRLLPPSLGHRGTQIHVFGSSGLRGAAPPRPHSRLGARTSPAHALLCSAPRLRN
ncbi:hypothetical protein NDU88_003740 [Pleurodeles waltl]|uniref:Uncharacterized protein n=1 Tax=Pleurodeles waltl TaxID=8319 RepID=A0AAV7QE37_PLEWA|nr:hypothetical protein NDU88_003740 [Pleurodeles waltl]